LKRDQLVNAQLINASTHTLRQHEAIATREVLAHLDPAEVAVRCYQLRHLKRSSAVDLERQYPTMRKYPRSVTDDSAARVESGTARE
jgi:hypothetical protein